MEVLNGNVSLLMSTSLLFEYEAVLTRPTVLDMIGIDAAAVRAVLDELAGLCVPSGSRLSLAPRGSGPR